MATTPRDSDEDALLAPGDILDNRYRIEGVIGQGGMGLVAAAVHLQLGRRVAVKVLRPRATTDAVARRRFLREARAAARLRNEHVVQVLDFGILAGGSPVIVMELLEGSDLENELYLRGPLPPEEVVDLMLQVCEAVAEAHACGLVHRDLKPSNLFVSRAADGSPQVKVLDFGVSKSVRGVDDEQLKERSLTGSHVVVGSPPYMAPEQVDWERTTDWRTDVWALGVILFELLTGTRPFEAPSVPMVFAAITRDSPPLLRSRCPGVPRVLDELVAWSLQKDPGQRCPDVVTFAQRLAEAFPSPLRAEAAVRVQRVAAAPSRHSSNDPIHMDPSQGDRKSISNWTVTSPTARSKRKGRRSLHFAIVGAILLVVLGAIVVFRGVMGSSREPAGIAPASAPLAGSILPTAAIASPPSSDGLDAGVAPDARSASPALPPSPPGRKLPPSKPPSADPPNPGRDPLGDRK